MLTDAAKAVSALTYIRRYTDATATREELTKEALAIAQDVLAVMADEGMVRERFANNRKSAEAGKERLKKQRERERKREEG